MKLLKLESQMADEIDQILLPVPDDYDEDFVLGMVRESIREPYISEVFKIYLEDISEVTSELDHYREYMG